MRLRLVAGLTGLLVVAVMLPAAADHGGIHPTFRNEQTYFHCVGDTKVQNASVAQGQIPSWDTNPPPGSVEDGHGCGFHDPLINQNAPGPYPFYAVWEGTFTGNLRDFAVELHRLGPTSGATFPNRFVLNVQVDGEVRYDADINLTPEVSSTSASHKMVFTLTGLGYANEDGDGTQERTIRLRFTSYNETQSIWVFDTSEVPAGVNFNPSAPVGEVFIAN